MPPRPSCFEHLDGDKGFGDVDGESFVAGVGDQNDAAG
jgi:hypothetical protein